MKKGERMSEEVKDKIRCAVLALGNTKYTPEVREKMSMLAKKNPRRYWLGKRLSIETKKKMSVSKRIKNPKYGALHYRVMKKYGKAKYCSNTDCSGRSNKFDWANVSGRYLDEEDYIQLCRSCHVKLDKNWVKKNYGTIS